MNKEKYFETLDKIDHILGYFNELIYNCGEVKIINNINTSVDFQKNSYHDYIYYCFTKSSRSLLSALVLAKSCLDEDCLIILRTVYENYLYMAHTLNKPEKIQEYVFQTVGLRVGSYSYKREKDGKLNYRIVVNNETRKEYYHGTNNMLKARESINSVDSKVHKGLYEYLSEYTHPNIIASGNYRCNSGDNYTAIPERMHLEVPFLMLYLIYLLLDAIYFYHSDDSNWSDKGLTIVEIIDYHNIKDELTNELIEYLSHLNTDNFGDNFKNLILNRIGK